MIAFDSWNENHNLQSIPSSIATNQLYAISVVLTTLSLIRSLIKKIYYQLFNCRGSNLAINLNFLFSCIYDVFLVHYWHLAKILHFFFHALNSGLLLLLLKFILHLLFFDLPVKYRFEPKMPAYLQISHFWPSFLSFMCQKVSIASKPILQFSFVRELSLAEERVPYVLGTPPVCDQLLIL